MRNWFQFLFLSSLAAIAGCGLLPKREEPGSQGLPADRLPPAGSANVTSRNGVLAGQVIDNLSQRRGGVNLTLQPIDGNGEPVQAITNEQGYFTVANLQSGKRYKILARSQNGTVTSTGSTEAIAPNVVVLIRLNDSKTETDGKSMGMSGAVGGKHSSIAGNDDYPASWSRGNPSNTGKGDRLGAAPDVNQPLGSPVIQTGAPSLNPRLGRPMTNDPSPSTSIAPTRPEYVTQNEVPQTRLPTMSITGPGAGNPGDTPRSTNTGSQYLDLPLQDLDGKPTSLGNYRGQLTLVDLWNTDCIPCVQAMTELMKVQRTYGPRGLVVVGIAVNERGRGEDNAAKIRWRTGQKGVDYPLFMEQPGRSAAQVFKVEQVPTLVLLDEQGREIWRNVGFNPDTRRALDQVLSSRLR